MFLQDKMNIKYLVPIIHNLKGNVWSFPEGDKHRWILDGKKQVDFKVLQPGLNPMKLLQRAQIYGFDTREQFLEMCYNKLVEPEKGLKETIFDLYDDNFERIKLLKKFKLTGEKQ